MCGHAKKPGGTSRRCRGSGGWAWLAFGLFFAVPWFWACDKGMPTPREERGHRFHLENWSEEAERTLEEVKLRLQEQCESGALSPKELERELEKARARLKGKVRGMEKQLQASADQAKKDVEAALGHVAKVAGVDAKPAAPPKSPKPPTPPSTGRTGGKSSFNFSTSQIQTWEVTLQADDDPGFSGSAERAKENVVQKAGREIGAWVRKKLPPHTGYSSFEPDLAFMKKENMILSGPTEVTVEGMPGFFGAKLVLQATPDTQAALLEAGRQSQDEYRMNAAYGRQILGVKLVGGISAALLALLAFFHLDDRTRGYYTKPLAAGLLAAAAAANFALFVD